MPLQQTYIESIYLLYRVKETSTAGIRSVWSCQFSLSSNYYRNFPSTTVRINSDSCASLFMDELLEDCSLKTLSVALTIEHS